jgi:hypothetical protein
MEQASGETLFPKKLLVYFEAFEPAPCSLQTNNPEAIGSEQTKTESLTEIVWIAAEI